MDDLIFRQAAIEACNQQTTDCNPDHFNGHEHFTEFLDDATIGSFGKWQFANGFNVGVMAARIAIKNIDPEHGRWIPVSEKLPVKRTWVLCKCRANIYEVLSWRDGVWYHDSQHQYLGSFVTHWRELPEPPKEDSNEV